MNFSIYNKTILNKKIFNSIKLYGLTQKTLNQLICFTGLKKNILINTLTDSHIINIKFFFESPDSIYQLEDIYRQHQLALKYILLTPSYKGKRLRRLLPIHGQRTHTNGKSCTRNQMVMQIISTLKD